MHRSILASVIWYKLLYFTFFYFDHYFRIITFFKDYFLHYYAQFRVEIAYYAAKMFAIAATVPLRFESNDCQKVVLTFEVANPGKLEVT